ncbi:mercuric reductase [Paramyrothecium foliicola]|nr:mercuric reductase [Paramyrothecium foliicola]
MSQPGSHEQLSAAGLDDDAASVQTTSPPSATMQTSTLSSSDAAGSNLDAGKRGRRSKPKVKTGCSNCKRRRIKCDEKRPACTQCVRSSKECTGYPPPSRSARPFEEIRIAPKPTPVLAAAGPPPVSSLLQREHFLPPRRKPRRSQASGTASPVSDPRLQSFLLSPTIYQPSAGPTLDQNEMLYFDLFRSRTASELSGFFDRTFWTQRVLQECHTGTAIQHAVIALGALYKTLEQSCEVDSLDPATSLGLNDSIMSHWQVAVRKYSEACNVMASLNRADESSHRTRLMATVLLACFDSFIGDHKQAIIQIQTGLGLLEQLRLDMRQRRYSTPEEAIGEELIMIFSRLAIQAKSYDMAFHFPQPYVIRLSPAESDEAASPNSGAGTSQSSPSSTSPPYHFGDVCEARIAADKLMERLIRFIERLYAAKEEPSNVLPESWQQYGFRFREQLDAWFEAYEPILESRSAPHVSPLEKSAIIALRMFTVMVYVLFLTLFYDTEEHFDAFMPYFKIIVDMGLELVREEELRATTVHCSHTGPCQHRQSAHWGSLGSPDFLAFHIKPSFAADMGIVPPLFLVATKCRDPVLRRQAIQLLRSSARREGMWDSSMIAKIAEWIMILEEPEDHELVMGQDESSPTSLFVYEVDPAEMERSAHNSGLQYNEQPEPILSLRKSIPDERRVMIKSVDFDLRTRYANVRVGTRGLRHGLHDERWREARLTW